MGSGTDSRRIAEVGITLCKRTIQKYMPKERKALGSSQTWASFLKNQANGIWACDFTVVQDWLFRQWYVFVVMELKTRRIVPTGITTYDEWTAQQLLEATSWGSGPKYLIRDRDKKYATCFSAVALGSGIKEVKTPYRTPQANGICERFMGSFRRECLHHVLIRDDKHVERIITEYTAYFNEERPHQGIDQRIPHYYEAPKSKPTIGHVTSKSILDGLHHSYSRIRQLN